MLKLVGGYYLSLISGSVTASAFGGAVGLLVWINLVARFAFFTAAWTATLRRVEAATGAPAGTPPGAGLSAVAAHRPARRGRATHDEHGGAGERHRRRRGNRRPGAASGARRAGAGARWPRRGVGERVGVGAASTSPGRDQPADAGRPGRHGEAPVEQPAGLVGRRAAGVFSVSITLTTSRRPSRSAAVTNVCRAASVNPVLPPRSPG